MSHATSWSPTNSPTLQQAPVLPVETTLATKRKTASGQIRGHCIHIVLPKHWAKATKTQTIQQFTAQLQQQFNTDWQLCLNAPDPFLTFTDRSSLENWVRDLNTRTLNVPLQKVRIGRSKYSRLAQMNTKNNVMTVSQYCLNRVSESALTYLIVHELAHVNVPNHSKAFWDQVKQHIPHVKEQSRLIQAFHRVRIYEDALLNPTEPNTLEESPTSKAPEQLNLFQRMTRILLP